MAYKKTPAPINEISSAKIKDRPSKRKSKLTSTSGIHS